MTRKPLVYVCGPYTHPDPVSNTHLAIFEAERLEQEYDVAVVIPHLSLIWHLVSPAPIDVWYARDLHLLERCDAVYRMAGASTGADLEVEHADRCGITVFGHGDTASTWRWWREAWRHDA